MKQLKGYMKFRNDQMETRQVGTKANQGKRNPRLRTFKLPVVISQTIMKSKPTAEYLEMPLDLKMRFSEQIKAATV